MARVDYVVTEGSIRVGKRLIKRGYTFSRDSITGDEIGTKELARLVEQGWLDVVGLPKGLVRGTIVPRSKPLPTTVVYGDAKGEHVERVEHGAGRSESRGFPTVISPDRETGPRELELSDVDEDGNQIVSESAAVPAGTPRGKWGADPAAIASKPIDQLNAMIHDVDPDGPTFEAGEEDDARRFLSADFAAIKAAAADQPRTRASGDAVHGKPGVRATRLNRG